MIAARLWIGTLPRQSMPATEILGNNMQAILFSQPIQAFRCFHPQMPFECNHMSNSKGKKMPSQAQSTYRRITDSNDCFNPLCYSLLHSHSYVERHFLPFSPLLSSLPPHRPTYYSPDMPNTLRPPGLHTCFPCMWHALPRTSTWIQGSAQTSESFPDEFI